MEENRELLRRGRRRKRKQIVLLQRIGVIAAALVVIAGGIYGVNQLPLVKINKFFKEAQTYAEAEDYSNALASYEKVLTIEAGTIKAYRYMANLYLDMEDYQSAEEILYKGLEETHDETIQETYLTVKYNESVNELNTDDCDFNTVMRLLEILEADSSKTNVYELMDTCRERLCKMTDGEGVNSLFLSELEGLGYRAYEALIRKMLSLYEKDGQEEIRRQLIAFIAFEADKLALSSEAFAAYKELVMEVTDKLETDNLKELTACLDKHSEIEALFAPLLAEFEVGNFEPARNFLISDEYIAIRDAFLEGKMEYWQGETYIPYSNRGVYLYCSDSERSFSFMDEEGQAAEQGYIKVWGGKWLDNGHQRTAITYVPAREGKEVYPMTEYCMMYWWSTPVDMELTVDTYARMNFRFEENTYTEEGKTTKAINDWGGKYEYEDIYE